MHPLLQAVITADARYNGQSPTSQERSRSADAGRYFYRNSMSLDRECGYHTVSSNSPRLDADGRLSDVAITVSVTEAMASWLRLNESQNIHNHMPGTNDQIPGVNIPRSYDQIPSDSCHILRVNDLIPDVSHSQQPEASHTQSMPSDQSAPSRQRSHRYTARSSQEDDTSLDQNAGTADNSRHAVVRDATEQSPTDNYLEGCSSQVSSSGEGIDRGAMSCLGSPLMRYTTPEDFFGYPEQSSFAIEDESEHESTISWRQDRLQQTGMFFDPQLLGGLVQSGENVGFRKMVGNADGRVPARQLTCVQNVFVHLCMLMAISILATISLLIIGSDYVIDSVSGPFLQETVNLYCDLPEFQVSGVYGALEFIATEQDPWINYVLHSGPGLDATSYSYYHGIPYSGYSNPESHDLVESWPVIPETGLTAFGGDLNYDTNVGQLKDSPNGFLDTPRIYNTPTTTIASPTIMPTMTSVPNSLAVDAMQTNSKASIIKRGLSLIQGRTSLLKHSLNRDSILGEITLRMTSLRIGR
jgi:hypothetical protein